MKKLTLKMILVSAAMMLGLNANAGSLTSDTILGDDNIVDKSLNAVGNAAEYGGGKLTSAAAIGLDAGLTVVTTPVLVVGEAIEDAVDATVDNI